MLPILLFIRLLIEKEEHIKKNRWIFEVFEVILKFTSYENLDWIHDAGATYEII